jgi:hypothetical protein
MPTTVYTEEQWFNATIAAFTAQFPTADLSDRGYFGLQARCLAQAGSLISQSIKDVDNESPPAYDQDADGNIRSRCSSAALDAWAFTFGLPSGVAGIYGRRGATISTGGASVPTGTAATLVPAGTQAADSTGQIIVETSAAVTLDGPPNTQPALFVSVTTGSAANLPVGSVLTWLAPPVGLDPTVTLTTKLSGAEDQETDTELVARLLRRIQTPPRGGTAADYRAWTEESVNLITLAPLGIERAYVYPQRSGLGSVDVVPLQAGEGATRIPGAATLLKVLAYVNTKRPITATVNIIRAKADATNALRIRVRLTPSPAKNGTYLFDWDDFGIDNQIVAFNSGAKTIDCFMPLALKTAVDNGEQPRIQIILRSPLATVQPYQARVVDYVAGAPDTMVLDVFPDVDPVTVAPLDYFYAGGGVVSSVADRILAYVDSLGPSRQSGFADDYDAWETDVTLANITDIVMDTRDSDGTKMIYDIPNLATTGVTISVGGGAFNPTSYTPQDIGFGIDLPFLRKGGGIEIIKAF